MINKFLTRLRDYQSNDGSLLREMVRAWENFGIFKKWVSRLFHHHNKKVALYRNIDGKSEHTDHIAVSEFRTQIYLELKRRLIFAILGVWMSIRTNIERELMVPLIHSMFKLLDEILDMKSAERKDFFEKASEQIISSSEEYFNIKLKEWKTDDAASYFDWLDKFSRDEEEIISDIGLICEELSVITKEVRKSFYETLLAAYKPRLVESEFGLHYLIKNKNHSVSEVLISRLSDR
jgi:Cullin family